MMVIIWNINESLMVEPWGCREYVINVYVLKNFLSCLNMHINIS